MSKIKVIPEGRLHLWLVTDKESLKAFIESKKLKTIHNFIGGHTNILLGAEHSVVSVLQDIERGTRIAVFTDPKANMNHALAIADKELEVYNIGPVTVKDLEVTE